MPSFVGGIKGLFSHVRVRAPTENSFYYLNPCSFYSTTLFTFDSSLITMNEICREALLHAISVEQFLKWNSLNGKKIFIILFFIVFS